MSKLSDCKWLFLFQKQMEDCEENEDRLSLFITDATTFFGLQSL
jgi:hypothetical protein